MKASSILAGASNAYNMKICSKCKTEKDINEFGADNSRKDKLRLYCKTCFNAYKKANRRKWYLNSRYKISENEYNKLFESQEGRCKICKTRQKDLNKILCIDHDHKTGKIRGLLCNDCNRAIGLLQDDKNIIFQAYNYLK